MVKSLSNKYVPTPSLDKVEIDILQSLKDFRHRVHEHTAMRKLHKGSIKAPTRHCPSDDASNINSWHKAEQPGESDTDWYSLGSNLYGTISAFLEVDSGKK
jgi:hypothetical protein